MHGNPGAARNLRLMYTPYLSGLTACAKNRDAIRLLAEVEAGTNGIRRLLWKVDT